MGHANHAITLGNFMEGRVWIEDENGQVSTLLETKSSETAMREVDLTCMTNPFRSTLRKYMLEKHRGSMWALAAFTPQAYKHGYHKCPLTYMHTKHVFATKACSSYQRNMSNAQGQT